MKSKMTRATRTVLLTIIVAILMLFMSSCRRDTSNEFTIVYSDSEIVITNNGKFWSDVRLKVEIEYQTKQGNTVKSTRMWTYDKYSPHIDTIVSINNLSNEESAKIVGYEIVASRSLATEHAVLTLSMFWLMIVCDAICANRWIEKNYRSKRRLITWTVIVIVFNIVLIILVV